MNRNRPINEEENCARAKKRLHKCS